MDKIIRIAIVFTCHNRAKQTKDCIQSLGNQVTRYGINTEYYICDDGSTDNTHEVIKTIIPEAHLINGDGNLFWGRGMHKAMSEAIKTHHDFYLMVNDDVNFENNAIEIMLNTYFKVRSTGKECGIVGSTLKTDRSDISYGGWRYVRKIKIGKAELLKPNGKPLRCDVANWNCFLIPDEITNTVGLIDPYYHHSKGDFDYSMMMKNKGYPIFIATDYIGTVDNNESPDMSGEKVGKRLKRLLSIKGTPPKYEFHYFVKNWGLLGFLFFFYSFPKTVIHELRR